jgi:hypothetical protein
MENEVKDAFLRVMKYLWLLLVLPIALVFAGVQMIARKRGWL